MEKGYQFLDITPADVAFVARGKSLGELFKNAALAMFETMTDISKVGRDRVIDVEVDGDDLESLMFNWLNELLLYVDSEGLVFSDFAVNVKNEGGKWELKATCYGEEINPEKHEFKVHVKAATYHKMEVKEKDGLWEATVVLDV